MNRSIQSTLKNSLYKFIFLIILIGIAFLFSFSKTITDPISREEINFNLDWKFKEGNIPDFFSTTYNDASWENIHLPHDFSIFKTPYEEAPSEKDGSHYPMGIGSYRKTFEVPEAWKNKKVYIHFDGISERGEVWVNGIYYGMRPYRYAPYFYDISKELIPGKENTIAVKSDNSNQSNSRWYTGSGIYRNVKLVVTNPVHIKTWGTTISTPKATSTEATVSMNTIVKNELLSTSKNIKIQYAIKNSNGEVIVSSEQNIEEINASSEKIINKQLTVATPKLWSPETPNLYSLETIIFENDKEIDRTVETFGIREFVADAGKGLFLNGKNIKLKGVCNHHDGGIVGTAVPKDVLRRRMSILKEMGCNAIRTSHNITSQDQIDLANEMGFIILEEAFDGLGSVHGKRPNDYSLHFDEWWKKDVENMIARDKNAPSIFMWSLGNELDNKPYMKDLVNSMVSYIHTLDPTRLVTAGNNFVFNADRSGISQVLDVVGYNGGGGSFLDYEEDHKKYPTRLMYGSEVPHTHSTRGYYQTTTEIRQLNKERNKAKKKGVAPNFDNIANRVITYPDLTSEEVFKKEKGYASSYDNCYNRVTERDSWRRTRDIPYLMGEFRWTGFDYLGESGWPTRNGNYGIIDLVGFPKDSYYFYQSQWTEEPMVHMLPHWSWTGKEGKKIPVWVYANGDEVELFLNGTSLGKKPMNKDVMYCEWIVPFSAGIIEAKSFRKGIEVASTKHTTSTELKELQLQLDKNTITTSFDDVVHIEAQLIDVSGEISPNTDKKVTFTVKGPGKIIGVGSGDPMTKENFKTNSVTTFSGLALCMVQSNGTEGEITVEATVKGIPVTIAKININPTK